MAERESAAVDAQSSTFAASSLFCAAVSTYVFAELYHMRRAETVRLFPGCLGPRHCAITTQTMPPRPARTHAPTPLHSHPPPRASARHPPQDLVVLASLFMAAAYCLFSGYKALLRVHLRSGSAKEGAAAAYFAVFQGNFAYFSAFAFLAYVALPAFAGSGDRHAPVLGLPWSWLHASLSILPASVLTYALAGM